MPIYEYRCHDCRRRVSIFWWTASQAERETPRCPQCRGTHLTRLVSRVVLLRSEEDRLEALADPSQWGDIDENDPRSVARFMRRMKSELGEDLDDEFDEMIDRLEAGEDLDEESSQETPTSDTDEET